MQVCRACGQALDEPLPIRRTASCPKCLADLRACRQCHFYDPHVANQCREPQAEWVVDKEKANFCDYFRFHDGTESAVQEDSKDKIKSALDQLFKK